MRTLQNAIAITSDVIAFQGDHVYKSPAIKALLDNAHIYDMQRKNERYAYIYSILFIGIYISTRSA